MDFAFLPPEINSARMYSGPGAGVLLAAAGSWDSLCAELSTAAQVYGSVLRGLSDLAWHGPTAQAMVAAATPYAVWLHTTAEQTQQTAMQARAAAAAFELAHAMTVPPTAVAANRAQLKLLVATNFFGQNTGAIAATEVQYAEYWAQDATAMYSYATSSAAATVQLTPFDSPSQTTNQDGVTAQNLAVAKADATVMSSAAHATTDEEEGFGSNSNALVVLDVIRTVDDAIGGTSGLSLFAPQAIGANRWLGGLTNLAAPGFGGALAELPELAGFTSSAGSGASLADVTVTLGRAGSMGSMSVPGSWTAPSSNVVTALPGDGLSAVAGTAEPAGSGSGMPGIPGMRPPSRAALVVPRYGVRIKVMPRPPCAG
jgi:PPE-repeat protein